MEQPEVKRCPKCDAELKVMLLLGKVPDGYVCEACRIWYSDDLKPVAHVIG
jgi:hypothetical protein